MDTSAIDSLLAQAVEERTVPGVVAVAGDRDGTLYEGVAGRLSVAGEEPVRPGTTMALASMTKAITSVAALQLMEQRKLELQQAVADLLPSFERLQVLEGFDGELPRLRAPAGRATIRQLLTHTSGLAYWFSNADVVRYYQLTGIPDPTSGSRRTLETPLASDPGTRWEYGTSTDWLGQVIEAVSGQDLASLQHSDAVRERRHDRKIVLDHQHRAIRRYALHESGDALDIAMRHAGGRLVEQHHLGIERERGGNLERALAAVR